MAALEQFVLDGLALNDATFTLESVSDNPAAKKPEWVSGADSDGALLGRRPTSDNVVTELRIRVAQQATMDLALAKIALVLDKLQECEQNVYGLPLTWTPADSTTAALTGRALLGEITDLPKDWQDSGWFVRAPVFTVRVTRLPFWEGGEYLAGSVTSSDPMQVLTITGVLGDGDGLGRLAVTDAATQTRRLVAWGLESRWLPTTGTLPALLLDSDSLTPSSAATTTTRAGAYDPNATSPSVIRATLGAQPLVVCTTGNQSHVGTYRVRARVWAASETTGNVMVRLSHQAGDGPMRPGRWATPPVVNAWAEVDLGVITIPPAQAGTQRWTGRIEAYSSVVEDTVDVDMLSLVPAESYGVARATYAHELGPLTRRDEFTGMTAGAALNARVAPLGGTWATSGAATDFAAADAPGTSETVARSTTADSGYRRAVLGTTSYTDIEVGVDFQLGGPLPTSNDGPILAVIARHVDASNYATGRVQLVTGTKWMLSITASASTIVYKMLAAPLAVGVTYRLRLVVFASGRAFLDLLSSTGATIESLEAVSSVLATGGTLASGTVGFADLNGGATATVRYYDRFTAATPPAEPVVIHPGKSIEITSDSTRRQDATGTYWGNPPSYVGGRFTVPPAGGPGRRARMAVIARRNDVEVSADDFIADSTTVQAYVTPRYLAVPRS